MSGVVDQKLASLAPEGVTLSPSSRGKGPWEQDLRPLEISAWHVFWWKAPPLPRATRRRVG